MLLTRLVQDLRVRVMNVVSYGISRVDFQVRSHCVQTAAHRQIHPHLRIMMARRGRYHCIQLIHHDRIYRYMKQAAILIVVIRIPMVLRVLRHGAQATRNHRIHRDVN